jgi:hypothetical protein
MDLDRSSPKRIRAKANRSSNRMSGRSGGTSGTEIRVVFGLNFKGGPERKLKLTWVVAVLSCAPLATAGDKAAYPTENVAQFVLERLDVTSLPSAFRPKKEKAKKTSADYPFSSQKVDENHAIIEAAGGATRLVIRSSTRHPRAFKCASPTRVKTAASQRGKVWSS